MTPAENYLYDTIILGSGPAGLSAAIYSARAERDALVIEKEPMSGGQIINTSEVDNYLGLPGTSGFELARKFREHCDKFKIPFVDGEIEKITIGNDNRTKSVHLTNGAVYSSKTIIIATGTKNRMLGIPGEEEMVGCGVSYCATCDGAFFRNRVVAVIGGGDVAVEDAIELSRLCSKVYLIHRRNEFRAARSIVKHVLECPNVEIIYNTSVTRINGSDCVTSIDMLTNGKPVTLEVSGVFMAVGSVPETDICKSIVELDDAGYIVAGETCETNIPGIFAAGDVRTKKLRQVITAAADGANAATSVERYLNSL